MTWTHLTDIPVEHRGCIVCCVEDKIYLVGGAKWNRDSDRKVSEYNPRTNTWRSMPSLPNRRCEDLSVCTLDNKIFVLGCGRKGTTCDMLDLNYDDLHPQWRWRYMADMNNRHNGGVAVAAVIEKKIYVLGGCFSGTTSVEMYDVDKGILME